MQTTVDIEIDEKLIQGAVKHQVSALFSGGRESAFAQASIRPQVQEWVKGLDFTPVITEVAPDIIRSIIVDEVASTVRAQIKSRLKEMQAQGSVAQMVEEILTGHG